MNELRFGYTRYYLDQYSLLNGTDYSTKYGVGNIAVPGFSATVGFTYMYRADGYLSGGSTYKPYHVVKMFVRRIVASYSTHPARQRSDPALYGWSRFLLRMAR